MATLVLEARSEGRIRAGHPWITRRDVAKVRGQLRDGDVVAVVAKDGQHLGMAIVNTRSRILARIYTRQESPLDRDYLERALREAVAYRQQVLNLGPHSGVRWVFSESDGLPGLIVDQYGPCVVFQLLTLAMEQRRQVILELLGTLPMAEILVEKSDAPVRGAEGLESIKQVWKGELRGPVEIEESGVQYLVDPMGGQKTGFFLDQRDNRALVRNLAARRRVLDAFCYTGGFAVAAACGGAESVLGIDASEVALQGAGLNAAQNGVQDRCEFQKGDVFARLRELEREGAKFDLIVLDPPAFAKTKSVLRNALAGYKEINLRALRLLAPGGVLLTCSCSQAVDEGLFERMLTQAAQDARKSLRVVRKTGQAADHPVLLGMPESRYLKCFWVTPVGM